MIAIIIVLTILSTTAAPEDKIQAGRGSLCGCPYVYSPVCGANQRSYNNKCLLECDGAKLLRPGRCRPRAGGHGERRPDCGCPYRQRPVCGSNGVSYINACYFNCDRFKHLLLTIQYLGACEATPLNLKNETCRCPLLYEPVCGSNNVTYANRCRLDCASKAAPGLAQAGTGPCRATRLRSELTCACPALYRPVCGSNNITFANKCRFNCASDLVRPYELKIKHHGTCEKPAVEPDCTSHCADTADPVCGSNNVTYESACLFDCAAGSYNGSLKLKSKGPCSVSTAEGACDCPRTIAPVCASNDITYMNLCRLECAAGRHLYQLHKGECRKDFTRQRPVQPRKKGVSTSKRMWLQKSTETSESDSSQQEQLWLDESMGWGSDEPTTAKTAKTPKIACSCPRAHSPVCANNGRTYDNECFAKCDKQIIEDLEILHVGQCNGELQSFID